VLSIQRAANAAELHFTIAPGRPYSVGWSDVLPNWQTISNAAFTCSSAWLAKSGTNVIYPSPVYSVWTDTNATSSQRFYRIGAQ
jgi:hypothetical protein